jgi:uncharacterized 2Fe-2S/4Fe-4S cluster protein (DUF4445 family)
LKTYQVTFLTEAGNLQNNIVVPEGTLVSTAAQQAGVELSVPCGGQGRCGRCAVQITAGGEQRRSTLRLSAQDIRRGYALGCQTTIQGDATIVIPAKENIEQRLTTNLPAAAVVPPQGFASILRRMTLTLSPPSLDNQMDDWSRLQTAVRLQTGIPYLRASLAVLRLIGATLRQGEWNVTAVIELPVSDDLPARLVALFPGHIPALDPLWGAAVDIGTTTVTVWLVELISGAVRGQAAEYNRQISRGEDVISRIIYASRSPANQAELQSLVLGSINALVEQVCLEAQIRPEEILRMAVAANSTMMHLFLGIPAESIRLAPFITLANKLEPIAAATLGLKLHPEAVVDCLPGVASYVGSDISAGVLACGLDQRQEVALFMDIGTNGETVLGCQDWLVTCACSAGPAFEGAGVQHGMRASAGAIEEIWIHPETLELSYHTIGAIRPRGICGSGLIALLSELSARGIIDKAGRFNPDLPLARLREGAHGREFVVAWGDESADGKDIVLTPVDIDNLMRAKAAIFAGFDVLAQQIGLSLDAIQRVLVGGSFGRFINIETAVQIGLLPDLPWDRFLFLGNTAVRGAYLALLDLHSRAGLEQIAAKMTYIELSADNSFYDAFMNAMFLPHTDLARFPSVVSRGVAHENSH